MDAAVGMKLQPDFKTAVAEMTRVRDTFEPDPHTHAIYEQLYREVYLHMYQHLKPLYNTLRHIH